MKFYVTETHEGRQLVSKQADAKSLDPHFSRIDIPTDHDGLKALVQSLWGEIDTLRRGSPSVSPGEALLEREEDAGLSPPPSENLPARGVPYAVQTISFEDGFAAMPLSLQLHFAGLALENARSQIPRLKIEELKS